MKKIRSILILSLAFIVISISCCNSISAASTIKINLKSASVIQGNYLFLKLSGTKSKIKWTSSDEYIADVSSTGKVTTKSIGRTVITAKVGKKKFTCKVTVIPEPYDDYLTDHELDVALAERDYIDNFSSDSINQPISNEEEMTSTKEFTDEELHKIIDNMMKYGFTSSEDMYTEIGKAYFHFCDSWVSEYELKECYGIRVYWDYTNNQVYLFLSSGNYIIKNTPNKFISGEIVTSNLLQYQYLDNFEYNGETYNEDQFYFNREDLIKIGIIK